MLRLYRVATQPRPSVRTAEQYCARHTPNVVKCVADPSASSVCHFMRAGTRSLLRRRRISTQPISERAPEYAPASETRSWADAKIAFLLALQLWAVISGISQREVKASGCRMLSSPISLWSLILPSLANLCPKSMGGNFCHGLVSHGTPVFVPLQSHPNPMYVGGIGDSFSLVDELGIWLNATRLDVWLNRRRFHLAKSTR